MWHLAALTWECHHNLNGPTPVRLSSRARAAPGHTAVKTQLPWRFFLHSVNQDDEHDHCANPGDYPDQRNVIHHSPLS